METLREKIENFPRLSDQECALILRDNFLEALESDTYIDWDIITKFIVVPYAGREPLCKLFNSAVKNNNQKIGNFTIGEWIKKYQDQYLDKERNPNTFFEYISNNPEIKKLSKKEQLFLARILRIYDYLLVIPIIDLDDSPALNIMRFSMRSEPTPEEIAAQAAQNNLLDLEQPVPQKIIIEKLILNDAIKKYPETGEQLITSQKIELKNFHELVRPSIKNWLADYISLLGYEEHDAIERSNYLFHTTNTRQLSTADRERLAYILKAFDEKTLIEIDTARKQIIFNFPARTAPIAKSPAQYPSANNVRPVQQTNYFASLSQPAPSPAPTITSGHPLPKGEEEFSRQSLAQKTQATPPNAYEAYKIKKIEPEQKLGSGKIFSAKADSNIQEAKFDFPQKMPFEKEQEKKKELPKDNLQPYRITSSAIRKNDEQKQAINPNNIIDLKNLQ